MNAAECHHLHDSGITGAVSFQASDRDHELTGDAVSIVEDWAGVGDFENGGHQSSYLSVNTSIVSGFRFIVKN